MVQKANWSVEQRQELVRLYTGGKTLAECCKILKAGQTVVMRYLSEEGVETRPAKKRGWSQERIDLCCRMYEEGRTIAEIAGAIHAATDHIARVLRSNGIPIRHVWTDDKVAQLIELYESGKNIGECSRLMKTSRKTVRDYLKANGIRIRPQSETLKYGLDNPRAKERIVSEYIYIHAPDHPHACNRRILEHRFVMEQHIGRYLLPTEVVHHKDKNKHNNAIENLQLFATNGEHLAFELKGQTPKWSEDGKARIDVGVQKWREGRRKIRQSKNGVPQ